MNDFQELTDLVKDLKQQSFVEKNKWFFEGIYFYWTRC